MFQYNYTRLLVPNFDECLKFYREVMGLEVRMGSEGDFYAEFKTGETTIALFDRTAMAEAIADSREEADVPDRVVLTFAVTNVDEAFKWLEEKGAEVVAMPKDREAWAVRTAHFRDPAGNLIEINAHL